MVDRSTTESIVRMFLRSIPIIPAPEVYDLVRSVRRSEDDLDQRIRAAFDSLSESSKLIDSLGDLLSKREQKLRALQQEYERVSELSTLTSKQAEAVARSLEKVIGKSAPRERLYSFIINIIAGLLLFVFGVFTADWVKNIFQ